MSGYFINSYLTLLLFSLVAIGHRPLQIALVVIWLVAQMHHVVKQNGCRTNRMVRGALLSQFPGMFIVACSVLSVLRDGTGEWADGALQVWVSPFLLLLDYLPAKSFAGVSLSYIVACITPFFVSLFIVSWVLFNKVVFVRISPEERPGSA